MTNNFIDIHAHIISCVDDGARSLCEAGKMLEMAYEEGVRTIIATPHFGLSNPGFSLEDAEKKMSALKKVADCSCPEMTLLMGNELYWSSGIIESLQSGEAMTLAGTDYVLVEFGAEEVYETLSDAVKELTWNGYRPIIAHAERYECIRGQMQRVKKLIEMGAYIQVNCRNFIYEKKKKIFFRKKSYREIWSETAIQMLKDGYVHFIASDMHDAETRCPVFQKPVEIIREIAGEKTAEQISVTNPKKLLKNEII